ncbi:MAG: GIY-YIG nuclease family protein [Proteobacteria bacterium]|nr:GIY-YIG nuclease family protein [Pseudomonadota bacterium]
MKRERTNVDHPLWRKKVDSSLFLHKVTTIPKWVCKVWNLDNVFPELKGKGDLESSISISFNKKSHIGQVTSSWPKKRADKVYRLWFGDDLMAELKETFLMSFMRDIEDRLRPDADTDIEEDIPFWEFLDIEFDEESKMVRMTSHYTQIPTFPELFRRLTYSPALKRIDDELSEKDAINIHKQDWRPRDEYEAEIGAENVIYMLIDTKKKLFYIGEADNLVQRFHNKHPSILNWDHYRYDVLPKELRVFRLQLERMLIRCFAAVLQNRRNVQTMGISEFQLVNDKIDL